MEFFERAKRKLRLYSGGSGIPSRINNSERGKAVSIDGFLGIDGIPISIKGRKQVKRREYREKVMIKDKLKEHPYSFCYIGIMIFIGVVWQWLV